jgi:hypothetical protein
MESSALVWVRYVFVFAHVIALAIALGAVLKEDYKLLFGRETRIDVEQIHQVSRLVFISLAALWATGLGLIGIDTGFSIEAITGSPKLMAKLTVVGVLTLNGFALHRYLLPMLNSARAQSAAAATAFSVVGAISMVSWLYAASLGVAKPLAHIFNFAGFISVYAMCVLVAVGVSFTLLRPRVERLLQTVRPARAARESYDQFAFPIDMPELR